MTAADMRSPADPVAGPLRLRKTDRVAPARISAASGRPGPAILPPGGVAGQTMIAARLPLSGHEIVSQRLPGWYELKSVN
jgi:hypothetical protein